MIYALFIEIMKETGTPIDGIVPEVLITLTVSTSQKSLKKKIINFPTEFQENLKDRKFAICSKPLKRFRKNWK